MPGRVWAGGRGTNMTFWQMPAHVGTLQEARSRKQEARSTESRRDHHPFELALAGTTYDGHVGHPAPLAIGSSARVQSLSDPGASSVRSAATPAERDPPVNWRPR
ncbi:hypothetical protein AcV7_002938 [Taiwanofungus camphoratus]|nr:hypothetical protein AcV7_002938 [Antrodia cinnamomea]